MISLRILMLVFAVGADAFAAFPSSSTRPSAIPHGRLTRLHESVGAQDVERVVEKQPSKKYVVVGGGWGGWGAAKALCERYGVWQYITLDRPMFAQACRLLCFSFTLHHVSVR